MASQAKRPKQDFSHIFNQELCTICKSRLKAEKPRWYRCKENHHLICQDCAEAKDPKSTYAFKDIKCPAQVYPYGDRREKPKPCKSYVNRSAGHCQVIAALMKVDKMAFKCENIDRGCQEAMDTENIIFHQNEECIYRLVKCPQVTCGSKVPFHELLEHITKYHVSNSYSGSFQNTLPLMSSRTDLSQSLSKIEIDGKVFFVVGIKKNQVFYHWIQLLGPSHEANNYSYTLEYKSQQLYKATFSHTNQTMSVDETWNSIITSQKCFGVCYDYFQRNFSYLDDDGADWKFSFEVKIRNLKEEVKDDNVESGVSDVDE